MDLRLLGAIRAGRHEEVKHLMETEPSVVAGTTPQGSTPLHVAARFGDRNMVDEILGLCPSLLMFQNKRGDTALHVAARAGNVGVVMSLMEWISQNNMEHVLTLTNVELDMAVHDAIMNGHQSVALALIDKVQPRAWVLLQVNKAGESPLSLAVDGNLDGVVKSILKACPSTLSHKNAYALTVLHKAILQNNLGIVKLVLQMDNDLPKAVDLDGKTPLHYASALGYTSVVQFLIKSDSSLVYLTDKMDSSSLHLAAQYGRLDVLKTLLQCCPDSIEQIDKDHRNILHIATHNGMCVVVRCLLKLPDIIDLVNATDIDGNTPLHLASSNYHDSVVYALVEDCRVDLSKTNNVNLTALDVAEPQANARHTGHILNHCPNSVPSSNGTVVGVTVLPKRRMGFQKNLTIRALMEASGKRGKQLEDILNRRISYKPGERPIDNKRAREVANTLTLMSTFVATITFNAAFTLPGGFTNNGGLAVLARNVAFQAFIVTDAIAMTSSMIATVILVWSMSRPENESFLISLSLGKNLTWIALTAMGLAFVTGLYAVLTEVVWLVAVVCCIGCVFPVILYVLPALYDWGAKQPRSNLANSPFRQYALLIRDVLEGSLGYRSR
ncbi:uncharacterized protein LOC141611505 [Silene latifolia]|uniref:uncharacterized protein LOC141611505 n=1 Tax=Silene latifolia TaxID=37657 RepID=UPI003D76F818